MGVITYLFKINKENSQEKIISFNLENILVGKLENCKNGDYVKLWAKNEMDKIFIYSPHSIGGDGRIGFVPSKYFNLLFPLVLGEDDKIKQSNYVSYNANMYDITNSSCRIEIELITKEEFEHESSELLKEKKISIANDLNANTKPLTR